jgi:hypothetical protein
MPRPRWYIPAVVTCGMVAFLFAVAFECNAPTFWAIRSTTCFDKVGPEVQSSLTRTKRPSDSLLDGVWSVRYCHRYKLNDHPDSCHNVPADADRGKDKVAHSSWNAAPVSTTRPSQSIALNLHEPLQTHHLCNRSSATHTLNVHVAQLHNPSIQTRYPYATPTAPRSRRTLHG